MQQRSVKSEVEEKTSRKENNERRVLIFVRLIFGSVHVKTPSNSS